MPRVGVVIPAGGSGVRMGGVAKPFIDLAGKPILWRTLQPFLELSVVDSIVIALRPSDVESPPGWLREIDPRVQLVAGGAERADSVLNAVQRLPESIDVIVVHDAARPLVTADVILRTIAAAGASHGAIAAIPVTDTLKRVSVDMRIEETVERHALWRAQTPQVFPRDLLLRAYSARQPGDAPTDDASLVETIGRAVVVVPGSTENLKITTAEDLELAELIVAARNG